MISPEKAFARAKSPVNADIKWPKATAIGYPHQYLT